MDMVDALLSIKSVLEMSSAAALELFRSQQLPFKAGFRRYEDDDEYGSEDEEQSDTDLQSHFQQEEANSIMHRVATQHKNHHDSIATAEWTAKDVSEWLVHFGKSHFNDGDRFKKYQPLILQNKVDGKALRQMDSKALSELGVAEQDIVDLHRGIQQLNSIIFAVRIYPEKEQCFLSLFTLRFCEFVSLSSSSAL